ncbi:MAG: sterol desaturase family protein, partial [Hyphomicrobiales bacterium]
MPAFEPFLRENLDTMMYGAFFGTLVVFGLLELGLARTGHGVDRARRWPANALLTVVNILALGIIPISGLAAAEWAQANGRGALNMVELPMVAVLIAGFAVRSLVSYVIHVLMHKVPVLWRIHRVHHTDTGLDVTTTVRFHPLEFIVSVPIVVAMVAAAGVPPWVIMLYELFDAVMAVFSHANLRLPVGLERVLQWGLVTPDMHRIHHSSQQPETDSNYGATLSVWDRLFGTYRRKSGAELTAMELGLSEWRGR